MKRRGRAQRDAAGGAPPVARITAVGPALQDDMSQRMRRYAIQMGVRTVCFIAAVAIDHWTRWVLLAAAVVLPYFAVLLANVGRERGTDPGTLLGPAALPAGTGTPRGADG